ncbi:DUF3341 domain-containing protein [Kiritimatiellota bacterium B12222]|nr:DUF3341 domain-containing protein [Kiritimatiellota bacterium B12222]
MFNAKKINTYGVVAEFADADTVLKAALKASEAGYTVMEAYSPVPVHGLDEALGRKRSILPWMVFAGGTFGCLGGLGMQYWMAVVNYPWNVGGRPTFSWPAFIPVTFELTILCSALTAVIGMFALNGLPRPHHPIFNTPNFDRSTLDHYFLCIEAKDPKFDESGVTAFLNEFSPEAVNTITDA